MEANVVEVNEDFLQMQYVVSVELIHPMQWGKRKVGRLEITMRLHESAAIDNGVLNIATDVEGITEHFPESNVAKWRIDSHEVPMLKVKNDAMPYEYTPYTYPDRVGGYLGSYGNDNGCLGFLDTDLQITMMEDLEA